MWSCLNMTSLVVAQCDNWEPGRIYNMVFLERTYEPALLVFNGGLSSGRYSPNPYFEVCPRGEVEYPCYRCRDSSYLTDPNTGLGISGHRGCTPGLYDSLLNEDIDFASWFRRLFDSGLLFGVSGFGVTKYALGESGYANLKAFMDSMVEDS